MRMSPSLIEAPLTRSQTDRLRNWQATEAALLCENCSSDEPLYATTFGLGCPSCGAIVRAIPSFACIKLASIIRKELGE